MKTYVFAASAILTAAVSLTGCTVDTPAPSPSESTSSSSAVTEDIQDRLEQKLRTQLKEAAQND